MPSARKFLGDIRRFGPRFLKSLLHRPDASGVIEIETRFGAFFIRPADTDLEVLRQIYYRREYDIAAVPQGRWAQLEYERILARGRVPLIIDAGANVGFAARFLAAAWPRARIVCVEPDPANLVLCRMNTRALSNVEVLDAAIGPSAGHVKLERSDGAAWATRTHVAETGSNMLGIEDIRARHADGDLLIVKVDIEGFEGELFAANTGWVSDATAVIVEPHDWMLPGQGTSRNVLRRMTAENRDLVILGENLVWLKQPA